MADDLVMSADAAAPIIEHFRDLSAELDNTRFVMLSQSTSISNACGEFSSSVEDGCDSFQMSWGQTFAFCGETASLIAGNTNVFEIALERLDTDLSHLPTI